MPAIVDRSPVIVAVSSAGTSPVLTTMIRARIEALLEPGIGRVAQWAGRWRARVKSAVHGSRERRRWWEHVLNSRIAGVVAQGNEWVADARLQQLLHDARFAPPAGRVALICAGPGQADLLTLRAARLLREADVIVHDHEVADDVLDLARRDAQRIDVSERQQHRRRSNDVIGELLVGLADDGRQVVRVKSGESYAVRRADDEVAALAAAGIVFEIVPGIADDSEPKIAVAVAPAVAA